MVEGDQAAGLEYVGFWRRVGATVIDTLLIWFTTMPLLLAVYGTKYYFMPGLIKGSADFLISWVLPSIAVIAFWLGGGATPGKMAMSARIVDAQTGAPPTLGQCVIRYLAYFVSMLPFFVGFIWVAYDSRKQGWHDKIAGTVVVRPKQEGPLPVRFDVDGRRREPRL